MPPLPQFVRYVMGEAITGFHLIMIDAFFVTVRESNILGMALFIHEDQTLYVEGQAGFRLINKLFPEYSFPGEVC
jgi:hypothetical protein